MWNARLGEAQAGIKIARRNINNLSYANGTTLREELDMEQQTGSKLGRKCVKAVYYHPAYLTYMQSISCKCQAGWITSLNQDWQEK